MDIIVKALKNIFLYMCILYVYYMVAYIHIVLYIYFFRIYAYWNIMRCTLTKIKNKNTHYFILCVCVKA